jgi:Ca2+-binding EF-hand superfamily protein
MRSESPPFKLKSPLSEPKQRLTRQGVSSLFCTGLLLALAHPGHSSAQPFPNPAQAAEQSMEAQQVRDPLSRDWLSPAQAAEERMQRLERHRLEYPADPVERPIGGSTGRLTQEGAEKLKEYLLMRIDSMPGIPNRDRLRQLTEWSLSNPPRLSPEDDAQVRASHREHDLNKDGRIDAHELAVMAAERRSRIPFAPRLTEEAWKAMNLERERQHLERIRNRTPGQMVREVYGERTLRKYDLNNDGELDKDEYDAFLRDYKAEGQARLKVIMRWYDTNEDGFLDEEELKRMKADELSGKLTLEALNKEINAR